MALLSFRYLYNSNAEVTYRYLQWIHHPRISKPVALQLKLVDYLQHLPINFVYTTNFKQCF